MKFSIEWLKKFIPVKDSGTELCAKITSAGLEVEEFVADILTIKVPPNRADCLGMVGMAREVAAATGQPFNEPVVTPVAAKIQDTINIQVDDPTGCPKYLSRIIKNIDNTKQTPQWIKDCLLAAEMNLISPVVDITNYVLLEWGQPLHAFDMRKVSGDIVVRRAKSGEELLLLDDSIVKLTTDTLIIADSKKPLAIAGVKGGKESGIEIETKDIILECAYFDPISIRLTSRRFGLKTDGAYRFERCIDPQMQAKVLEHITKLLLEVVGGEPGPIVESEDLSKLPQTTKLKLRLGRIKKILGVTVEREVVLHILQSLGFKSEALENDELQVTVPSFRPDITREIDLIEEVARIYGLDRIPEQVALASLNFKPLPEAKIAEHAVMTCLINRGYHETITYSFIDVDYAKSFVASINNDLQLTNPISSEMGYMRPSLLPGLIKAVQYNHNRQQERIRLFEIGLRFKGDTNNIEQQKTVAGVCFGNYYPEGWANLKRVVDLFDVKGDVLALLKLAHNLNDVKFTKYHDDPVFHPGQALKITLGDQELGVLGVLHPQLQQNLELPKPIVMFELDYELLTKGHIVKFENFSKFPTVRRDIAILVDKTVAAGNLEHAIHKQIGNLLVELVLFDVYQGKGIPEHQKSMALGLTLQNTERTLTDNEVSEILARLMQMLQQEFNAVLR